MVTISEVPLISAQQQFTVMLNNQNFLITATYNDVDDGGWVLNIADSLGNPIVSPIPLVTGCDLLEQYEYLAILPPGCKLFVASDGEQQDAVPTYTNLGAQSHLYLYQP